MNSDIQDMGPIDYFVIEFPGSRMNGEGLPLLVDLVDRGTIRILDLVFIEAGSGWGAGPVGVRGRVLRAA
jgi:hypothetical protein